MAMFQGFTRKANSRTDMRRLFVSEGISPAEEWILDPNLPEIFTNPYGSPGQTRVVIGKGMAVSFKPELALSYEKGVYLPVLTLADGNTNYFGGVAPYNLCRGADDRFEGNQPAIIRRNYVEIPWFVRKEDAAAVKYGALFGSRDDVKVGKYVKVSNSGAGGLAGKYEVYDPAGDSYLQAVGMIMGIEMDVEPWGWFKWVMWDEAAKRQDDAYLNPGGKVPNAMTGFPYDPDYKTGRIDMNGYLSQMTTNPTGIPGLLDGENRKNQRQPFTIPGGTVQGANLNLGLPYNDIIGTTVAIYINNAAQPQAVTSQTVDPITGVVSYKDGGGNTLYTVNPATGAVVWTADQLYNADTPITVFYQKLFYGTPPGWDTIGFTGMVRILLR